MILKDNPNATVGLGSGAGGGTLLVFILTKLGVDIDPYVASVIAGALSGLILYIGRNGVRGLVQRVWRGSKV